MKSIGTLAIFTLIFVSGCNSSEREAPAKSAPLPSPPVAGQSARSYHSACSSPLDPFLSLAERLRMPVAVREHHIELSLHQLAEQLDAANSTIRSNLQEAIIQLHNAGYTLKNHPQLTHAEAHMIADEDAV